MSRYQPMIQRMQPVLTALAQRAADQRTMEQFGLSGLTLMETAGRAVAAHISETNGPIAGRQVDVLVGRGNNGGDGFVIARVLHAQGANVRVWASASAASMMPDAAHQRRLLEDIAVAVPADSLSIKPLDGVFASRSDLYVDALLGTGLNKPLRAALDKVVSFLNAQSAPVVAVDIPTGLHADTGAVLGRAVHADSTVTMGALKPGLLMGQGPACAGRVITADIGIPPHILSAVQGRYSALWYSTDAGVRALLPRRPADAHKYSVGPVLVIGGAPGFTGAAVMASQAAARVGAGYVTCATHASVQPILAEKLTATVTVALAEAAPGDLDVSQAMTALAFPLRKAKAILAGPGLGSGRGTQAFVRTLLKGKALPAVVDADGLNSWVGFEDEIAAHSDGKWIITPHAGELARLTGEIDLTDRLGVARTWAKRWNAVLIVKGMPSVVGTPSGEAFICGAGNAALATAGSGDILAGMCAGLLAQGLSPTGSAVAALHLGGRCAEHYCQRHAARSMVATDMLDALPHVLKDLGDT